MDSGLETDWGLKKAMPMGFEKHSVKERDFLTEKGSVTCWAKPKGLLKDFGSGIHWGIPKDWPRRWG
jgi:hypothetical protein